jgi:hypothetical protein
VHKDFDGLNSLTLALTNADYADIASGDTLTLVGHVSQSTPCVGAVLPFVLDDVADPNYELINTLEVILTIGKGKLTLSGNITLAYNGDLYRHLPREQVTVGGLADAAPVGFMLVFESDLPGAALVEVKVFGEFADCYEMDFSGLQAQITPAVLRPNADVAAFAANGSDTRVLHTRLSYLFTTVAQGDSVYVELHFSSAESGATLIGAELIGADAETITGVFVAKALESQAGAIDKQEGDDDKGPHAYFRDLLDALESDKAEKRKIWVDAGYAKSTCPY